MGTRQEFEMDPQLLSTIEELVSKIVAQYVRENELKMKEISLVERLIRVEEELKALREIQMAQFEAMEKRFEALQKEIATIEKANQQRFEAIEKRLNFMQWFMGLGFTFLTFLITLFYFLKS